MNELQYPTHTLKQAYPASQIGIFIQFRNQKFFSIIEVVWFLPMNKCAYSFMNNEAILLVRYESFVW